MTRRDWLVAAAMTSLALGLRLLGVGFGLPWFHHWDEGWVAENATHMLQTPDWQPRTYHYGAPLSMLMALSVRAMSALVPSHLFDPGDGVLMRIVGRVVTALLSSTGTLATYVAARSATLGDRGASVRGAYAAVLYATASELVSHGRYAVTDACLVALVAWSLATGALFVRGGRFRWAGACIAFAAIAAAFKITAAPAVVIPLALLTFRSFASSPRVGRAVLLLVIPSAVVIFLALNPHVLLQGNKAVADISARMNQYSAGGVPEFVARRPGFEHLASILFAVAFQVPHRWLAASAVATTLSAIGLALALRERSLITMVGVGHAAIVVLGLAVTSRAFLVRNYLVVAPIMAIGLGFAMNAVHAWIAGRARARLWHAAALTAFGALYVAVPAAQAVRMQQLSKDARARALDWIVADAHGSRPVSVAWTPEIDGDVTGRRKDVGARLARPNLVASDVADGDAARRSEADYVLIVSNPDRFGRGEDWPFTVVAGYHQVARFDANPYEHNFAITPTWGGRYSAIVLERQGHP